MQSRGLGVGVDPGSRNEGVGWVRQEGGEAVKGIHFMPAASAGGNRIHSAGTLEDLVGGWGTRLPVYASLVNQAIRDFIDKP